MIGKTMVLVFFSFACAKFSYAEITETELGDGTIVRRTTTRITAAGKPVDSNGGNMQDESGNYSFRDRIEPIIIVNPSAGPMPKPGLTPHPGYPSHNGHFLRQSP
ncbi:hypothetical protein [Methylomicrobium album]|uniref:hypothetical protein n=1 Tax=Methylomicrobium album TaxID=39775 RepID=UPI001BC87D92|nr:hypothetical protein [Methylomicrobium album]